MSNPVKQKEKKKKRKKEKKSSKADSFSPNSHAVLLSLKEEEIGLISERANSSHLDVHSFPELCHLLKSIKIYLEAPRPTFVTFLLSTPNRTKITTVHWVCTYSFKLGTGEGRGNKILL